MSFDLLSLLIVSFTCLLHYILAIQYNMQDGSRHFTYLSTNTYSCFGLEILLNFEKLKYICSPKTELSSSQLA